MQTHIKELAKWLMNQAASITIDALEDRLQEAYSQGRFDAFCKHVDNTLNDIHHNTLMEIKRRKAILYEQNFYNIPSDEVIIEMKALQYVEEHIGELIRQYRGNENTDA